MASRKERSIFSRKKLGKKNKKFVAHFRHTGKAMSDFGAIRALRLGEVADRRNPIVPGANWFGILVYVDYSKQPTACADLQISLGKQEVPPPA